MDLYQLRYFLEVARELNFTRAAENLHISPPAVSRSVSLLEKSLGRRLFTREGRKVELTAEGRLLKDRAEAIYDAIEGAKLALTGQAPQDVSFLKIGSREMITDYLLPQPLLTFRARHPKTRFAFYELDPAGMADALKKDQVDFGLYYADIQDPALESRHLGRLISHIYAAKKLFPGRRPPKSLRELLKCPFIAPRYFRADPTLPSVDGFPDARLPRNIQYEAEFLETHHRFVLDGLAAAVLPDMVMKDAWRAGAVLRFAGPPLSREIYFFKRRGRALPAAADYLCGLIRERIKSL